MTHAAAQVEQRLKLYGANEFDSEDKETLMAKYLDQVQPRTHHKHAPITNMHPSPSFTSTHIDSHHVSSRTR